MAEVTKKILVLTFGTPQGKKLKLTINNPKKSLTSEEISTIMDEIIDTRTFGQMQVVSEKLEAKYIIQEEESVELES